MAAFDVMVPNVARIYDYLLGGKDNFEADREAAEKLVQLVPDPRVACQHNRVFLKHMVEYLVSNEIRQFPDIGAGLPTLGNVHEIAQGIDPGARVV